MGKNSRAKHGLVAPHTFVDTYQFNRRFPSIMKVENSETERLAKRKAWT